MLQKHGYLTLLLTLFLKIRVEMLMKRAKSPEGEVSPGRGETTGSEPPREQDGACRPHFPPCARGPGLPPTVSWEAPPSKREKM